MERYELIEGTSSKFWEVAVDGRTLTVRFGRIGTQGQAKEKDFDSADAATKEKDKLVKEKTGKGYVAAGSAPPAPKASAPATAAKPAADPAPAPAVKEEPAAAAAEPAAPMPAASDELETVLARALPTRSRPGGGLDGALAWTALRSLLLPMLPKAAEKEADAVRWIEEHMGEDGPKTAGGAVGWLKATFGGRAAPQGIDAAQAVDWVRAIIRVSSALFPTNRWQRGAEEAAQSNGLAAFARWLVETAGAATAVDAAQRLRALVPPANRHYETSSWSSRVDLAFRDALVKAPDADYDAAVAFALEACKGGADWEAQAHLAFILADDRPAAHALQALAVLEAAAASGLDVGNTLAMVPLIAEAPPADAARWRVKKTYFFYFSYCDISAAQVAATALAAARQHGQSALPALDWLLHYATEEDRTGIARVVLATDEAGALALLVPHLHEKWIRAALDGAMEAAPARTFRQCLSVMASGRAEPAIRSRIMEAAKHHSPETLRHWAGGDPKAANYLERVLDTRNVGMAAAEAVPAVLRDPPWRRKAKAKDDIVLDLAPIATPFRYGPGSEPVEKSYWHKARIRVLKTTDELVRYIAETEAKPMPRWYEVPPATSLPKAGDDEAAVLAWLGRRLVEIDRARTWALHSAGWDGLIAGADEQPDALALMLWGCAGPMIGSHHWQSIFPPMMARFGERALPGLLKQLETDPIKVLTAAVGVDAGEIAPHAARALLKLKKARPPAIAWLRRHPTTAITRLIPDAVGKPGAAREAAETALRWLAADTEGARAGIEAVAATYAARAPRAAEAVIEVLDRDPLSRHPARIGKLPAWFEPGALARPVLKEGGALPDEAVEALAEMLSFSTPEAVYAGIDMIRQACTRESLAAFAWDLFSAWLAEGAPSKDGWAMRAVGWLGDDECARQLTRLIRKWPGEAAHARAVTGLDVLVDIGSDVALMNLNGIAEKLKFKGLQDKAREKIAALAEARDLTPEELSDRLAPDLDLDERGGLDIVFGERRFRAGFDEFLKPWVKDATGQRLKDLPKPNKSDDPELAEEAVKRWSALKKDARAAASLQISRLETMLSTSRRVRPAVFWTFFAAHPLIRHLTQRLVWGRYDNDDPAAGPSAIFRVADDLSVTDAKDDALDLDVSEDAAGLVGLVHPLQLPPGGLDAWGALFGDYEISQPFPQLGRETYALEPPEKAASEIHRFDGIKIESPRLRGMASRGWELGAPQDGGGIWWLERPVKLRDGTVKTAMLTFEQGLVTGGAEFEDKLQTLKVLSLHGPYQRASSADRTFGELDAISASEMLRGLSLLAEAAVP
ncbi:DUF4132 domain-containing protein [Labrys wisconsinensis]|uniref:DNA-binding WGR domain protein n=1 Tax=Labrys wisconsinensis TaxID=425677 RepID=A0ABU0J2T1_9HYPH|nr:DUF4132 domain-containing protein [Labrys wisconsinensis]MDQ0468544.1 putative DNA-binding WGR domain protein [Labrys wisconsinensis]